MAKKYEYNKENYTNVKVKTPRGDLDFIMLDSYLQKNSITFSDYVKRLILIDMENPAELIDKPSKASNAPFYSETNYEQSHKSHTISFRKGSETERWLLTKPKKATYLLSLILNDIRKNKELYYK